MINRARRGLVLAGVSAAAGLSSGPVRSQGKTLDLNSLAAAAKAEGEVTYYASTNPVLVVGNDLIAVDAVLEYSVS